MLDADVADDEFGLRELVAVARVRLPFGLRGRRRRVAAGLRRRRRLLLRVAAVARRRRRRPRGFAFSCAREAEAAPETASAAVSISPVIISALHSHSNLTETRLRDARLLHRHAVERARRLHRPLVVRDDDELRLRATSPSIFAVKRPTFASSSGASTSSSRQKGDGR